MNMDLYGKQETSLVSQERRFLRLSALGRPTQPRPFSGCRQPADGKDNDDETL